MIIGLKNEELRSRLRYEWDNILKVLAINDLHQSGYVSKEYFAKAVCRCKVYLSREDYVKIFENFVETEKPHLGKVDYSKITKDLICASNGRFLN